MDSACQIFSSISGLAMLVDHTCETTEEFYSLRMVERFIANNYFENWFTDDFIETNHVDLDAYQHMELFDEQLCLCFEIYGNHYVENLKFKFLPGWFIANMEKIIFQNKAFVTLFMRNEMASSKIYLIIDHNSHLISIY